MMQRLPQDLNGAEPQGQARIALEYDTESMRWGQRYRKSNVFVDQVP